MVACRRSRTTAGLSSTSGATLAVAIVRFGVCWGRAAGRIAAAAEASANTTTIATGTRSERRRTRLTPFGTVLGTCMTGPIEAPAVAALFGDRPDVVRIQGEPWLRRGGVISRENPGIVLRRRRLVLLIVTPLSLGVNRILVPRFMSWPPFSSRASFGESRRRELGEIGHEGSRPGEPPLGRRGTACLGCPRELLRLAREVGFVFPAEHAIRLEHFTPLSRRQPQARASSPRGRRRMVDVAPTSATASPSPPAAPTPAEFSGQGEEPQAGDAPSAR